MSSPMVARIVVDLRANQLLLDLGSPLPHSGSLLAIIDIGTGGRLLGVETAGAYLAIADPAPGGEAHVRTAHLTVRVVDDGRRIVVPRRGPDWEISFPSGNQCWARAGGSGSLCAVLAEAG